MDKNISYFDDPLGKTIYYYKWTCKNKAVAAIQIVHGMAEHAFRYNDFANFLTNNNIIVYANDHRGHGLTAGTLEETGYFADKNGWEITTEDIQQLTAIIKKENPEIPLFILGHSMGSLLVRNYFNKYPEEINGLILSGTSYNPSYLLVFGKVLASMQKIISGKKHRSMLLDKLSFGKYNSSFKPNRTKFDWLSRDDTQVDNYVNDSFCGFVCTTSFYSDLFGGILKIQKKSFLRLTPKNIPVLIVSGENDPVGNFTKGVNKVYNIYKNQGIRDINAVFYKDSRHEILNEINKDEVYTFLLSWIHNYI
ncbi:MAG: alpha/beta hydrolase [Bacteroidales bacterium]|jgi:alpha-beta hydrolase superfamily lysophospholipase